MTIASHLIRRQILAIELHGAESDGVALHRRLPEWCHEHLRPAIERALDRVAPPHEYVRIDELQIDAGTLSLDRLEHDLPGVVEEAVETAMRAQLTGSPSTAHTQRWAAPAVLIDAFVHFLRLGRLPWTLRIPTATSLENVLRGAFGDHPEHAPMPRALLGVLSSPAARERLIQQFSPGFVALVMDRYIPDVRSLADRVIATLRTAKPSPGRPIVERHVWLAVLEDASTGTRPTEDDIVRRAWAELHREMQEDELAVKAKLVTDDAMLEAATAHRLRGIDRRARITSTKSGDTPDMATLNTLDDEDVREGIFIEDAGLVLLHPFIPRLFEGLGIAENDIVREPDRALAVLHYLATGQHSAPEYTLVLPKLLCNVPFGVPTGLEPVLRDADCEEADAMLRAAITHWDALRDTTPDALRGTFLIRSGKLSLRADATWLLQVESKGFDILLDRLPWSISMIRLPWMTGVLQVEWN